MAPGKAKQVTKAAEGTSASHAKTAVASKSFPLSSEMIEDSDLESDTDSSDSDSEANDTAPSKSTIASLAATMLNGSKVTKKKAATQEDAESVSSYEIAGTDSNAATEDEDDSSRPPPSGQKSLKKSDIPTPKVNGVKRKTTSKAETASESSNEDEEEDRTSKKARVSAGQEEEVEDRTTTDTQETSATPSRTSASQHSSLTAVPVQEYVPPRGYRAVDISDSTVAPLPDIKGKTIWHISAPIGVPVSSIKSITMAAIKSTKPVLSYEDVDYTLTEVPAQEQAIFLPRKEGYKAARQAVKKSFSLRPAFTLPTIPARAAARDAGSLAAGNIATAAVTSIRPQPKGLKMRYKPPGFGKGKPGRIGGDSDDGDEDESQSNSTFQFPRAVGPSTDGDGSKVAEGEAKQKKKKKQKGLAQAPDGIADHVEPTATMPEKTPLALDKVSSQVVDIDIASDADEKDRLKAEKKAKKAAKKAAKKEVS